MTITAVLAIIEQLLELANRLAADMPPDQKVQFWTDVKRIHDFWQGVADKLHAGSQAA